MSRTYRRKNSWNERWNGKKWCVSVWSYTEDGIYDKILLESNSKEYEYASAKFHSDTGTHSHKEPGPSWFRNLYSQRPHRRQSRINLQRYVQGEDFDVIIEDKPKLPYWT